MNDGANVTEPPERIPWVRPILDPDESLLADIHAALSSGRVTNDGPKLREFERRLAGYLGVEDCVTVSSGSAALLLGIWALDLRGGTAILPSFTFPATLNAILLMRALRGRLGCALGRSGDPPRRPGERVRGAAGPRSPSAYHRQP